MKNKTKKKSNKDLLIYVHRMQKQAGYKTNSMLGEHSFGKTVKIWQWGGKRKSTKDIATHFLGIIRECFV